MSLLVVEDLRLQYGSRLVQQDVSFEIEAGTIFGILGGSGCGKSTVLKSLVGLLAPSAGRVRFEGEDYWHASDTARDAMRSHMGMLFQSSALWSSMTVLENVMLPMSHLMKWPADECEARAMEVLGWVDMAEARNRLPADLSGGMKKRVGLARAIATQPRILYLDEPSAGLDPINAVRLDELILSIRERTQAAIVIVTHELPSIYGIVDDAIFLDAATKRPIARGKPATLRDEVMHPTVQAFMHRKEVETT
ncbi:ATP-binding cassette domain-containing protein [Aquabacterium fontiphilum]|uniref:ABC transporter ATP-binding protein n=1 Tax=Aquabacterium fontiphilum TaxID=450365 RepID=UPI001378ECF2|nr:ATP-binding cassette domain-containing protein [Aquabacterium fontiphilum]NBD21853.1 ATP-binding cassette domain-containing protein [Aquabacterium fontiphilum]